MKFQVVGCSHHKTAISLRERLAFSPGQVRCALGGLREQYPETEAVLLSTCNRVELYTAAEEAPTPSPRQVAEFLARFHDLDPSEVLQQLYQHEGEEAVRHLFTVAASLDSMVVGEPQILSQVKGAYQLATDENSTGPLTHLAFQAASKTARRVAGETAIHSRRVSIPSRSSSASTTSTPW